VSTWKLTILAVLLAHSAEAAQSKSKHTYTRKQGAAPTAALSERARPGAPKPAAAAAAAAASERRPINSDAALSLQGLLTTFRADQERILLDLIRQTPDRDWNDKANLYFILGELYAKQQRYYRLKSQEREMANDKAKAAEHAGEAYRKLVGAVTTYKALTDNPAFRNYARLDEALFYYGYTLKSARKYDEARAVFDQLLKDHPRSKYVPEAHLVFADYFFERDELANAAERYRMVLKFPQSTAYWYAMYQTGWISLKQGQAQEALERFYQVAQATRRDPQHEVLNRAAKKDYVRAYAEVGRAELAYNAFARVDDAAALQMLEQLADHYLGQGKSAKAIVTYQDLMKRAPTDAHVCLWQYNVAQATLSLSGATNADRVTEIENLVRVHSALAVARTLPKADAEECRDNAAAMAGDHARAFHAEFAKTQDPATLAHSDRLYRVYLDAFPAAPDQPQTQYFHAELLWARAVAEKQPRLATELWERAAEAFARVVVAGKVDAPTRKEAAYAAVLAWKNTLDVDPRPKVQAGPVDTAAAAKAAAKAAAAGNDKAYAAVPKPRPIPEREQKMLAAFDLYITYIRDPKDDELIGMKFLKANVYRRYDHHDRAIPLFLEILEQHRAHETAEYAAQLLLDSYNRLRRHDEMLAMAARLGGDAAFLEDKPELRKVLTGLRYQAMEKRAHALGEAAQAAGDFAKWVACGQEYMTIYNSDPERAENDRVLYNAMVCFHKGKSIGLAILAFEVLEKYYRASPHLARALALVGKAYGDTAFYDKATAVLERYARKYAGESDAPKVMSEVVFYNKGLGDDAKAIANTKYFIDAFGAKHPAEAADAMFSLASVYEKRGDTDGLVRHLRAYLARFGETGGAERRVIAHAKIGLALWAASCPVKLVDGSCVKVVRERAIGRRDTRLVAAQKQCGDATRTKLTVVARDARKVKDAMAAFAATAAAWGQSGQVGQSGQAGGKLGAEALAARHYYAQARLAEADREYEAFLAIAMPANLDFHKAAPAIQAKSLQRFDAWLRDRKQTAEAAVQKYEVARQVTDNATSIAAVARLAQIQHNQADALFTTEIPLPVRTGAFAEDKIEAFCDRMSEVGDPLEEAAIRGYQVCLEQSKRLGWFGDWSKLCERELGQLRPVDHPPASELRAAPTKSATIIVVEPPLRRLE
jgi:tetratricopeptide (TPR) repeat protein